MEEVDAGMFPMPAPGREDGRDNEYSYGFLTYSWRTLINGDRSIHPEGCQWTLHDQ